MQWKWCIIVLLVLVPVLGNAHTIPSSRRSRQVIQRCKAPLAASLARSNIMLGAPVFIRIFKRERRLELWMARLGMFIRFKCYPVCTFGGQGLGPKTRQGDSRAPEGFYYVAPRQLNPYSRYHLAFNVGYPNAYDRCHGRTGGLIMVHGGCVSIGCFAMTDAAMEEIYTLLDAALRNGQRFIRVHIFPFDMKTGDLESYRGHRWYAFWLNLKQGFDWFERRRIPPNVTVREGRYHFSRGVP